MEEKEFLKIYQIYFKPDQLESLTYAPYYNSDCTPFFEHSVMKKMIEEKKHLEGRYFGILPYKFADKKDWTNKTFLHLMDLRDEENLVDISSEHQLKKSFIRNDVISFTGQIVCDPVSNIEYMHKDIIKHYKYILGKIGISWNPTILRHVIYSNLFVAKSEIYERFVNEMLAPAMAVMSDMPELYEDSGYPNKLPDDLKEKFGVDHYPYHAFILERFISYFIHIHKLKCSHF